MTFDPIPKYRRAVVKTTQRTGSPIRLPSAPPRFVLHVTVGVRLYDYPWPPHFSVAYGGGNGFPLGTTRDLRAYYVDLDPALDSIVRFESEGDVVRLQHVDVTKAAYALLGPGDPPRSRVETNHAGHCLQTEIICPPARSRSDFRRWEYRIIAKEIANQIHGLRLAKNDPTLIDPTLIVNFRDSSSYGFDDPYEMEDAEWLAFDGIAGHQSVPGQSHWDPGDMRHRMISRIVTRRLARLADRDFGV